MPTQLSDSEIQALLAESKQLPPDFEVRLRPKPKSGHEEAEIDVPGAGGAGGSAFRLIIRRSLSNPLDFSVILAYHPADSNILFRLRRYNGKSHEHSNRLEGESFYEFHRHTATERYQEAGFREDTFAETDKRFADLHEAMSCLFEDCGFQLPRGRQLRLFGTRKP